MKKRLFIFLLLTILIFSSSAWAQSKNQYLERRQRIIEKMSPKGLLVLQTPPQGGYLGYDFFHQESNLFYLTGMNDQGLILILSKYGINSPIDNKNITSLLIAERPLKNVAEGDKYSQLLQDSLGFDLVCGSKEKFNKIFKAITEVDILYTNVIKKKQKDSKTWLEKKFIELVEENPSTEIKSPNQLTTSLRFKKIDDEISLIQKAIDITTTAHKEAMKSLVPGLFEYQIEAVIEFIFKFNGALQLAFPSIVGAGPNSIDTHYMDGTRKIEPGDMVVIDIGCKYNHYCADITRTIPASGKFSPQQKEIYNIVLEANEAVIEMLKPGVTTDQMNSLVREVFSKYGYEKYIKHGCSHSLGLDVHDVEIRNQPFEPGVVVTVEPGLYIPPNSDLPQEYWNIGVRIEDDVLITAEGHKVLTQSCPKTVEEIEKRMKVDGIVDMIKLKNN